MKIPTIIVCCFLSITGCATRAPADGPPPGHDPDRIYVGPPISGDLEDRMRSQNNSAEDPQSDREGDWPRGPFGFNMEGLKIVGMILVIYGLMGLVQRDSSNPGTPGSGSPALPLCIGVSNPVPGLNCR